MVISGAARALFLPPSALHGDFGAHRDGSKEATMDGGSINDSNVAKLGLCTPSAKPPGSPRQATDRRGCVRPLYQVQVQVPGTWYRVLTNGT